MFFNDKIGHFIPSLNRFRKEMQTNKDPKNNIEIPSGKGRHNYIYLT